MRHDIVYKKRIERNKLKTKTVCLCYIFVAGHLVINNNLRKKTVFNIKCMYLNDLDFMFGVNNRLSITSEILKAFSMVQFFLLRFQTQRSHFNLVVFLLFFPFVLPTLFFF